MRPNTLIRTLVGATTVVGIAAGGLAGAHTGAAASPSAASTPTSLRSGAAPAANDSGPLTSLSTGPM